MAVRGNQNHPSLLFACSTGFLWSHLSLPRWGDGPTRKVLEQPVENLTQSLKWTDSNEGVKYFIFQECPMRVFTEKAVSIRSVLLSWPCTCSFYGSLGDTDSAVCLAGALRYLSAALQAVGSGRIGKKGKGNMESWICSLFLIISPVLHVLICVYWALYSFITCVVRVYIHVVRIQNGPLYNHTHIPVATFLN